MRFDQNVETPYTFKEAKRTSPDKTGNILIWLAFAAGSIVLYIVLAAMIVSKHLYLNIAGALGFVTIAAVILVVILDKDAIRTVEQIWGHDIDGDGYIGPPPVQEFSFQASERTAWRSRLPAPEPVLRDWATAALNGGSLAYSSWCKRFATRPNFSDGADRYREFRQALVRSEWAIEQGTHSITLTPRGEQVLTEWLHQNPDPTPLLDA